MSVSQEQHFVERVTQYPIVNDTYGKVADYYSWAKNKHYIVNSGLNMTESILQTAVSKAQPVINKFDSQISSIDQFSCRQLDRLEQKFPLIHEPTSEIMNKTKEAYETSVKQRVCGVVRPVVYPVIHTVSGVRYGVSKVTETTASIGQSMYNSRGGKMVLSRLYDALDLADRSIDHYLPEDSHESDSEGTDSKEVDELQMSDKAELAFSRVSTVSQKLRRRMYLRAMNDLNEIRLRSQENIRKMTRSIDLVAYTRSRIDSAKKYTIEMETEWRNAMLEVEADLQMQRQGLSSNEEFVRKTPEEDPANTPIDRVMESARFWAHRLRVTTTAAYLITYRSLPEHMQEKLDNAKVYSSYLYEMLSRSPQLDDLKTSLIDRARNAISVISENMEAAFDYVKDSRLFAMLYDKKSAEAINMQTLDTRTTVYESSENDTHLSSNDDCQPPLIPLIRFSPTTVRQDCQDATLEDSVRSTDSVSSLRSGHMPLVSDDELE